MKDIRIMGGLGAILGLLSFIPYVGFVFGIASLVLVLLAIHRLSNYFSNKEIFSKFVTGFILSAIGLFFVIFFAISVLIVPLRSISSELGNGFNLSFSNQFQYSFSNRFLLILGMLTILGYVMNIVGMSNYRKSFHLISQSTGIDYFRIVGNLYLWGAITSIIFIGGLLFLVAQVLLAVAFFSLPDSA